MRWCLSDNKRLPISTQDLLCYLAPNLSPRAGSSRRKARMAETKDRHGCLTAWLVLTLIANAITAFSYAALTLLRPSAAHSAQPHSPTWARFVLMAGCIANIVFAVALFRWKRWGFLGFLVTTILALAINLSIGIKPAFVIIGASGIIILYGVLQIGDDKKGWDQLE